MKFKNLRNKYYMMNLQIFADEGDTGNNSGDGDDQDGGDGNGDPDEDGNDEPKFTQADMDKAIARTIAKERAKAERAAKRAAKTKDGVEPDENPESEDAKARKAAESKVSKLEVKVACFEAGVDKDAVDDVAALAHAYMEADEDLDLEDAIEKVVKKYPHFKKSSEDSDDESGTKKSWGERQNGRGPKKLSGVEKRFYELNPDLKK